MANTSMQFTKSLLVDGPKILYFRGTFDYLNNILFLFVSCCMCKLLIYKYMYKTEGKITVLILYIHGCNVTCISMATSGKNCETAVPKGLCVN